jgi:hypothetical protein
MPHCGPSSVGKVTIKQSALADEETGILIDSLMVSVGSTNFAPRSFHLNDEANLNNYAAACQKNFWSMPRRSSAQL